MAQFSFTPLVSPAITPLTSYSTGPAPASHVTPAELFSPLTSPVIQPVDQPEKSNAATFNLQALVEQAGNMGLISPHILPQNHQDSQRQSALYMSQQAGKARQTVDSAAGPSRRSQAASKTRPSPIIRPMGRKSTNSVKAGASYASSSVHSSPVPQVQSGGSQDSPSPVDLGSMPPPSVPVRASPSSNANKAGAATPTSILSLPAGLTRLPGLPSPSLVNKNQRKSTEPTEESTKRLRSVSKKASTSTANDNGPSRASVSAASSARVLKHILPGGQFFAVTREDPFC
jgi:hypothetical protein